MDFRSLTMAIRWNIGFLLLFAAYSVSFDCQNTVMDIALVIPTKGNISETDYATMIDSIENLIKQFSTLKGRSHVAIVQFAEEAKVRVNVTDLGSQEDLDKVIKAVQDETEDLGENTYTFKALDVVAKEVFKEDENERATAIDVIILFTNKPSDDKYSRRVIKSLEGKGIYRVVVGIGNDIKGEEIEQITGGKEGGFRVGNFDDLKAKTNEIHNVTCNMLNCEDPPLDICLVIDQTESVRLPNYKKMLDSVNSFIQFFAVGENKTHFAIVTFANQSQIRISFSDIQYQNHANLSKFIVEMKNDTLSRPTRTDRALWKAGQEVFNETNGDRPNAPGVMIVLTDGKTHKDSDAFKKVLIPLKRKNVHRIAVGIGPKVIPEQLKEIAGGKDGVINVASFENLSKELRKLREVTCSINGGFSEWSSWTVCTKSCGGGVRWHNRTCTKPVPKHRGKDCKGDRMVSGACNTKGCPIDGNYTEWSEWSECSVTCNGGVRSRTRTCSNPAPKNGGENCVSRFGAGEDFEDCNTMECAIDGNYTKWTSWSECSASCDGGVRWRTRNCTNPAPEYGGKDCKELGGSKESEACNTMDCGHNGNYTNWSNWSKCSSDCDGVQIRYRLCTHPPPEGLASCTGNATETRACGNACPAVSPCEDGIDLALLIDCSNSVRHEYFRLLLRKFIPNFVRQFKIGEKKTRVGIVMFNAKATLVNDFRSDVSFNTKVLLKKIKYKRWDLKFKTRIDRGLELVSMKLFSEDGGDRKNKSNVLVVLTDGKPFPPDKVKPFNQTLPPLRNDKQANIAFVGFGKPGKLNYRNLKKFAVPNKIITLESHKDYGKKRTKLAELRKAVCEINGGYTPWGEWSTCSDTCGNGVQIRSRSCTAPPQRKGGKDCSRFGPSEETKTCNVTPCATGF